MCGIGLGLSVDLLYKTEETESSGDVYIIIISILKYIYILCYISYIKQSSVHISRMFELVMLNQIVITGSSGSF